MYRESVWKNVMFCKRENLYCFLLLRLNIMVCSLKRMKIRIKIIIIIIIIIMDSYNKTN